MFAFVPGFALISSLVSSFLALDLPVVKPGEKPYTPVSQVIEEYSAQRQWIPASAVPMGEYGLDLSAFPDDTSWKVKRLLKSPAAKAAPSRNGVTTIPRSSCSESIDVHGFFPGAKTFDAMLRDSTAIFAGTIVLEEPGFLFGIPVLLMRLKIDNVVLPAPAYREEFVDVFYPHANFSIHGYQACGIQAYEEIEPKVGDKAFVFAAEVFPSRGIAALSLAPERIAIESAEGKLSLPRSLRLDRRFFAAENLSQVENAARRSLAQLPPGAR